MLEGCGGARDGRRPLQRIPTGKGGGEGRIVTTKEGRGFRKFSCMCGIAGLFSGGMAEWQRDGGMAMGGGGDVIYTFEMCTCNPCRLVVAAVFEMRSLVFSALPSIAAEHHTRTRSATASFDWLPGAFGLAHPAACPCRFEREREKGEWKDVPFHFNAFPLLTMAFFSLSPFSCSSSCCPSRFFLALFSVSVFFLFLFTSLRVDC